MSDTTPAANTPTTPPPRRRRRRRRRRTAIIAGLIALLLIGPYLASRLRSSGRCIRIRRLDSAIPPPAAAKPSRLIVAAYNIAHGRGDTDDNWEEPAAVKNSRIVEIAELLAKSNADVVVLNEVDFDSTWSGGENQAAAIARAAGYPQWVEQRNIDVRFVYGSWKFGNAILSKYPIVGAEPVEFPPHAAYEDWLAGRKRGVVATLKLSNDQLVRVLAVHLEHRRETNRVAAARMIVQLAEESDDPLIAAGDFNSTLPGFPQADTAADGENAMAILRDSGRFLFDDVDPDEVDDMTYPAGRPNQIIDWILIPPQWSFAAYQVQESLLSDHRPVVARIRFGGSPPP